MRIWNEIEEEDPEISTESLIARTMGMTKATEDEVLDALECVVAKQDKA